jgi:rhodanese-related sulfurtransferase
VTSMLWSELGTLAERAPKDNATLASDLGLSAGTVVAIITIAALLTIAASDRIAARPGATSIRPAPLKVSRLATVALALGTLAAASSKVPLAGAIPEGSGTEADSHADHVDALVLAEWIRDRKPQLRVVDVREGLASDDYRIPGAEEVPLQRMPELLVRAGETIVLYGDDGGHAALAWSVLRSRGVPNAFVLRDGLAAWEDNVLSPHVPNPDDTAAVRRFDHVKELSAWFGGRPSHEPAASAASQGGAPAGALRRRKSC